MTLRTSGSRRTVVTAADCSARVAELESLSYCRTAKRSDVLYLRFHIVK